MKLANTRRTWAYVSHKLNQTVCFGSRFSWLSLLIQLTLFPTVVCNSWGLQLNAPEWNRHGVKSIIKVFR